ncbi:hypothetical protein KIL84_009390 [Mauremys mutica]|uniref:Uncharacterized protein n=1 Tax=Mauremys mutica TaxID=74926 RepID=A0A9D4B4X0_9SAUR|nr:hypothetical protein KIL84_009390 [Mauremys mutica]
MRGGGVGFARLARPKGTVLTFQPDRVAHGRENSALGFLLQAHNFCLSSCMGCRRSPVRSLFQLAARAPSCCLLLLPLAITTPPALSGVSVQTPLHLHHSAPPLAPSSDAFTARTVGCIHESSNSAQLGRSVHAAQLPERDGAEKLGSHPFLPQLLGPGARAGDSHPASSGRWEAWLTQLTGSGPWWQQMSCVRSRLRPEGCLGARAQAGYAYEACGAAAVSQL